MSSEALDVRFEPADPIRVVQDPKAPEEPPCLVGREGFFVRYTAKGYAMVALAGVTMHGMAWPGSNFYVHPENLERL